MDMADEDEGSPAQGEELESQKAKKAKVIYVGDDLHDEPALVGSTSDPLLPALYTTSTAPSTDMFISALAHGSNETAPNWNPTIPPANGSEPNTIDAPNNSYSHSNTNTNNLITITNGWMPQSGVDSSIDNWSNSNNNPIPNGTLGSGTYFDGSNNIFDPSLFDPSYFSSGEWWDEYVLKELC